MSGEAATAATVTSTTADISSPFASHTAAVEESDEVHRDARRTSMEGPLAARTSTTEEEAPAARASAIKDDASTSPTSPTSPTKKRVTGLFNKFKRRSKHTQDPGLIGGTSSRHADPNPTSTQDSTDGSVVPNHIPNPKGEFARRASDVSSRGRPIERTVTSESKVSQLSEYEEARDTFNENLAPPPSFPTDAKSRNSGSPVRDSKFHEVL